MLHESEFLAALGRVIGVEDFGDGFGLDFFAEGFHVAAGIEGFQIEVVRGLCLPKAEHIHGIGIVSHNRNVPRKPDDGLGFDPLIVRVSVVVKLLHDTAVQIHGLAIARSCRLPRVAILCPSIGLLDLLAIHEFLPEKAKLVMDTVSDGR